LYCSFTVIGRPRSGFFSPFPGASSAALAAALARSKSRTATALILPSSASMLTIAASTNSRAESLRAASAFRSSIALR
jgi:hypothetical protein